jgi:uncharacterized protein YfaS (alpha-2-macroglobulin family)
VAKLSLAVKGGNEVHREHFELPVRPASPRVALSGFRAVAAGSVECLDLPGDYLEHTARYRIDCSALPDLELAGSLDYLLRYPYGCVEQTTSSVFPLLYFSELAASTHVEPDGAASTDDLIRAGVLRLLSMQQRRGGFAYWPGSREVYVYGSVYAAHFLVEAAKAGYALPEERYASALHYLEGLLGERPSVSGDCGDDSWRTDRCERAYAAYVLALAGRPPRGWLNRLAEEGSLLPGSARAQAGAALALADCRDQAVRLLGPATSPPLPGRDGETGGCLRSRTRDTALLLSAWVDVDPGDPRVAKLVHALHGFRRENRWSTTQENAVALLALGKYARSLEQVHRPFEATVSWDNGRECHPVTERQAWSSEPRFEADPRIWVTNAGPGTVYAYWRSEGVVCRGLPEERDHGVVVRRRLLNAQGEPLVAPSVAQGDLLVVELTVDPLERTIDNLVLVDLLPAGLEPENPKLATSRPLPWVRRRQDLPLRNVELRDDRVLIFARAVSRRRRAYYAARCVTPGDYVHPPAVVTCMYDPDIISVSGAGRLEVLRNRP